jgi:hypothetical protein
LVVSVFGIVSLAVAVSNKLIVSLIEGKTLKVIHIPGIWDQATSFHTIFWHQRARGREPSCVPSFSLTPRTLGTT